jgi:hypothetical protein
MFGLPNDEKDKIINQYNFLLLFARYYIYPNKQAGKSKLQLYELLIIIKSRLEIMQNIALEQNRKQNLRKAYSV